MEQFKSTETANRAKLQTAPNCKPRRKPQITMSIGNSPEGTNPRPKGAGIFSGWFYREEIGRLLYKHKEKTIYLLH